MNVALHNKNSLACIVLLVSQFSPTDAKQLTRCYEPRVWLLACIHHRTRPNMYIANARNLGAFLVVLCYNAKRVVSEFYVIPVCCEKIIQQNLT